MNGDDLEVDVPGPEAAPPERDADPVEQSGAMPTVDVPGPVGAPLLPALAAKVDTVERLVGTLALRLEALTGSTEALRTSLEDRLDTVADLVEADARGRDDALAAVEARLRKAEEALARLATLVEVVVDTMPGSAEGSG